MLVPDAWFDYARVCLTSHLSPGVASLSGRIRSRKRACAFCMCLCLCLCACASVYGRAWMDGVDAVDGMDNEIEWKLTG